MPSNLNDNLVTISKQQIVELVLEWVLSPVEPAILRCFIDMVEKDEFVTCVTGAQNFTQPVHLGGLKVRVHCTIRIIVAESVDAEDVQVISDLNAVVATLVVSLFDIVDLWQILIRCMVFEKLLEGISVEFGRPLRVLLVICVIKGPSWVVVVASVVVTFCDQNDGLREVRVEEISHFLGRLK